MSGSTNCEREEEMEELVLGTLSPTRAAAARGHLSSCDPCAEAHRLFAEERALFTNRAALIIAPPPALLPLPRASLASRMLPASRDLWSVTRVAAAALACAAAIVCVFREPSTPRITNESVEPEPTTTLHASARASLPIEEGLACAYPASGVAPRIATRAIASVPPSRRLAFASNDIGMCEEQPSISSGQ